MSFLSGLLNLGKSAVGILTGNSIVSTLARTAILGYAINKVSKNAVKGTDTGTQNIDEGVRLQIAPDRGGVPRWDGKAIPTLTARYQCFMVQHSLVATSLMPQ
jgi:hypothetical protein